MRSLVRVTAAAVAGLALAACSADGEATPSTGTPAPAAPTASGSGTPPAAAPTGTPRVTGTVVTGLEVPWGVAVLPDGAALVGQRPTGRVVRVGGSAGSAGTVTVGTVPGVADQGEGGLLGLAFAPSGDDGTDTDGTLYAYLTSTAGDNRVVRMAYRGGRLGPAEPVLTGIASAYNHNGGLLALGPDGNLWIGTGDAAVTSRSQDRRSLNGKILRIRTDGKVPADNPFRGSPVYSLGHRNVQGLAFDAQDRPWAVEFGQNTWDELNLIRPGANYGWPLVEGKKAREGFTEPQVQWPTDEASPSGMAIVGDAAYVGALRGERLWKVPLDGGRAGTPQSFLRGDLGRLRTVVAAPDGGLWVTTSNRDGRGDPRPGDDRMIDVTL